MQTEAVFEKISERIQNEIQLAQKSIFIAVAWFTNKNIFNELVKKAENGCLVNVIISNDLINLNSSIDFDKICINNLVVYKIGNGDTELMHNKFCVIDFNTVISGSYNWSYKAESNFENIIITKNDIELAKQFIDEFYHILKKYYPNTKITEHEFPLNIIIKRLEILKNYILLEDAQGITKECIKLNNYNYNSDIFEIGKAIQEGLYGRAINLIQKFTSQNQQILVWTDDEINALKFQIKNLENKLNAYHNEKVELEKLISIFQLRHNIELGSIILNILKLRKIKYKTNKSKFEEAENDEKKYKEQYNSEKEKIILELNEEDRYNLKMNFRKATTLCHPDRFVNESIEIQEKAEEIFKILNKANSENNLIKVAEILENLEKGILSTSNSNNLSDKNKLKITIKNLEFKVKIIEEEIINIKQNETFITISKIQDWDYYFSDLKYKLLEELHVLENNKL